MMKNLKIIIMVTLILCGFVFGLTVFDFAALHDINKDYVSQYILDYLKIDTSQKLPDWTATKGEWQVVPFSLYSRFLFFILNIIVLIYFYRKIASKETLDNEIKRKSESRT